MISIGELFRLGFSGGCRSRGVHHARKRLSAAAAAASNRMLGLHQPALPGHSSVLGEILWKEYGLYQALRAQLQEGEPYYHNVDDHCPMVACLDPSLPPCDEGYEQNLAGYWGRTRIPLSRDGSITEKETLTKSGLDSRLSAHGLLREWRESPGGPKSQDLSQELAELQPSDGRESPYSTNPRDLGQEFHICGRDDGVLSTEGKENLPISNSGHGWRRDPWAQGEHIPENVQVNDSGSEGLLGQEVNDESDTVNHVVGSKRGVAAILAPPPRVKSKQKNGTRKLTGRALRSCSSSTGKLKPPGRKGYGGPTLNLRHDARTVYVLNRQINSLMELGYCEEAFAIYEKILPAGCKPDSYTYLHLIKGFCEGGELAEARKLFKRVLAGEEDYSCGRSEVILYNAMVHGLGSAGLVKEALDLVEEMKGRGFAPDMYTYNSILHSLGKVGRVTEALTMFESMADEGCSPDIVSYNSVINWLGKAGKPKEAYKLYEGMRTEGCLPDHVTFNTLIPILGNTGELDLAISLYEFMTTIGCEPDVYTYTSLVAAFCRANRTDEALLLSVEMTEKGCAPNTATFNSWLDGLCKGGKVVEAGLLFDKMLMLGYVPDEITYSILIDAFCKTGQFVDKSFELLKDLLKCSICILDTRTSEIVYQSFKKVGMLKQAKRIARNARAKQSRCVGSGLKLSVSTLKMVSDPVRGPH